MNKPLVFDFIDCSLFLKTYYEWRKAKDNSFSFSSWAKELGFSNKTIIRLIVHGKRNVSPSSAEKFREVLQLSSEEFDYFKQLMNYQQSHNLGLKQLAGKELMRMQRRRFVQEEISIDAMAEYEELVPVIRALLVFSDVQFNAETIAKILNVSKDLAEKALCYMEKKGIILQDNGIYTSSPSSFHIPDQLHHQGLKRYYQHWIEQSQNALEMPINERRFRSLIFALSDEAFKQAVEMINDFSMSVLSQFHSNTYIEKRLFMLNTALFPIGMMAPQPALEREKKDDESLRI